VAPVLLSEREHYAPESPEQKELSVKPAQALMVCPAQAVQMACQAPVVQRV